MTAPMPPLRLAFADWYNAKKPVKAPDGSKHTGWKKKLARRGPLTQYAYGTYTRSDWGIRCQRCIVCAPHTGVFAIDVDYHAEYSSKTRLARLVGPQDAMSHRGDRWHALVDARHVPADQWPRQGPIAGGDIKSNGWVPVPGSEHYSGDLYEPVINPDGTVNVVIVTPEMLEAIAADRADADAELTGRVGGGGRGGGHRTGAAPLPPTEELLRTGLSPGRRSHDMYRLALRLVRQDPAAAERVCFEVWKLTPQVPEPFGWPEAADCIDSARGFIQDQEQSERVLMSQVRNWLAGVL
jgi:hypothetical protein